jgi:hypothetical protein
MANYVGAGPFNSNAKSSMAETLGSESNHSGNNREEADEKMQKGDEEVQEDKGQKADDSAIEDAAKTIHFKKEEEMQTLKEGECQACKQWRS